MKKEFENNKKNALGNNPDLRDDIDDEMFQKILREECIENQGDQTQKNRRQVASAWKSRGDGGSCTGVYICCEHDQ